MKEFFPTPEHVITQLIEGINLRYKSVLDPSAGKGDILARISDRANGHYNLYAIEIEPELRSILTDKGFKVIGTNFLTYPGLQYFDFILMNPPFSEGAAHLLHAWDIANGATIRCLLNAETINNPYTKERKRLVSIIERYGWSKELGAVFNGHLAERKANVNVVLVHLEDTRPKEGFRLDFDFETTTNDLNLEDNIENEVALANIFESYESRYKAIIAAFKELLAVQEKVKYYLAPLVRDYPDPEKIINDALATGQGADISYQKFLEASTRAAWDHLYSKTKLGVVTTEGVRRELAALQLQQGIMAFTSENMEDLFQTLFLSREHIMIQCVLEIFDDITKYYKENREYYEGWKTNSAYKVGKKFILPGVGSYYGEHIDYSAARKIADIEKALCFLAGKQFENIAQIEKVYGGKSYFGQWIRSEFFDTKLFKKRTMHFKWLDEDLRIEFNRVVARERWGELPEKVKYKV